MSRDLRIQYPSAWYQVMNRGLNRRRIFKDDSHRELFLEFLSAIHNRYGMEIHAYCLMSNHYHLLIHTLKRNISQAMRHLNSLYTKGFNRREKRDGPLFRGRYKAILIEAEHCGLELSRYLHMNRVAAKICLHPEDYRWSSYKELKDIAQSIGKISISGISQIKRRLQKKIKQDKSLQLELERLKRKCGFASSVKT